MHIAKIANTNENKRNVHFIENGIILSILFKDNLLDFSVWKHYFFQSVQKSRELEQIVFDLLVRTWKEKTALKEVQFSLDTKNKLFGISLVKQCNWLPREIVDVLFLETCKIKLDGPLSNLI